VTPGDLLWQIDLVLKSQLTDAEKLKAVQSYVDKPVEHNAWAVIVGPGMRVEHEQVYRNGTAIITLKRN
jgi:hypothetical protein